MNRELKSISLILLAYGEAKNLDKLLPSIKKKLDSMGAPYEILIIDGVESIDNTKEICDRESVAHIHQKYPGYGDAFRTAVRFAKFDTFLILDADGSIDVKEIQNIYNEYLKGYDLVIGSRYIKGGGTEDSKVNILMSRALNCIYRKVLGLKPHDISLSFRIYTTEQLKNIKIECNNYDTTEEVLFRIVKKYPHMKYSEIPIFFHTRKEGASKRKLLAFILTYLKTLLKLFFIRISVSQKNR